MIEAGPNYWSHFITEYIPELKTAASGCSASEDPINCIDWDEITLGALASHTAGLPRDCMSVLWSLGCNSVDKSSQTLFQRNFCLLCYLVPKQPLRSDFLRCLNQMFHHVV
jgi:hypothetical protein